MPTYTDGLIRHGSYVRDRVNQCLARVFSVYTDYCPYNDGDFQRDRAADVLGVGPNPSRFINSSWVLYFSETGHTRYAPVDILERIDPFPITHPYRGAYFSDLSSSGLPSSSVYEFGSGVGVAHA